MRRLGTVLAVGLVLAVAAGAGAAFTIKVLTLKSGERVTYKGIECEAATTTYSYLTCFSSGPYEVSIGKQLVTVVRAKDGKVLFQTP